MQKPFIIRTADNTGREAKMKTMARGDQRCFQTCHLLVRYTSFNFRDMNLKEIDLCSVCKDDRADVFSALSVWLMVLFCLSFVEEKMPTGGWRAGGRRGGWDELDPVQNPGSGRENLRIRFPIVVLRNLRDKARREQFVKI